MLIAGAGTRALARLLKFPLPIVVDRTVRAFISLGILAAVGVPLAYSTAFVIGDHLTSQAWSEASAVFEVQADALAKVDVSGIDVSEVPVATEAPVGKDEKGPGGNVLDWARSTIDGAVQGSSDAIQSAFAATKRFAAALKDKVSAGALVIANGVKAASDLFKASADIGIAYLTKLIILPVLILIGFVWVMRSITRPEFVGAGDASSLSAPYVEIERSDGRGRLDR